MIFFKSLIRSFFLIPVSIVLLTISACQVQSIDAPTNVSASDGISASSILVTWDEVKGTPMDLTNLSADYYKVYRSNSTWIGLNMFFEISGEISGTVYKDDTVITGSTYYYKVKAFSRSNVESEYSEYDDGFAGGDADAAPFPIVLVHGMGVQASIIEFPNMGVDVTSWWQIQPALEQAGSIVYTADLTAAQSSEVRAMQLKELVLDIMEETGKSKVNLIAHSQGGIDARFMITHLFMGDHVASLSMIGTPHRGSPIADVLLNGLSDNLEEALAPSIDLLIAFFYGTEDQSILGAGYGLTTSFMVDEFNPNTPDVEGVYYQSWAGKIIQPLGTGDISKTLLSVTWQMMMNLGMENDGMVSVDSAVWGNFRGVVTGTEDGISHYNLVNHVLGNTPGWDALEFYVDMVDELRGMGY